MSVDRMQRVAEQQARQDKLLGPGFPIFNPKTGLKLGGNIGDAVYDTSRLKEYINGFIVDNGGKFPEFAVQCKLDGCWCQIHRDENGKLFAFTEGMQNVTSRLPTILKIIDIELPRKSYIIIGEIEGWVNGKHQGRELVSGYLSANTPVNDMRLVFSVFDIIWYGGKDLHRENYKERYTVLNQHFYFSQSVVSKLRPGLNLTPTFIVKSENALEKAVATFFKLDESEGAMIKLYNGYIFSLNKHTNDLVKVRKYAEAHFTALEKRPIANSSKTFQYVIGVLIDPAYKDRVDPKDLKEYDGKDYIICGKTFNTNIQAKVGEVITVKFSNVNVYFHNDIVSLGIYAPNVYENRTTADKEEQPDTITSLLEIGRASGLLVEKSMGYFISKLIEPFVQYPSESQNYRYVIQAHFRGKSVHSDIRIKHNVGLIGYTLMNQVQGILKAPVETLAQAKLELRNAKLWKFDAVKGKFQQRRIASGQIRDASIQVALKESQPDSWLEVEGVTEGVGSTANFPGVFVIAAAGRIEYGYREPYFHEYFFHNPKWPSGGLRLIFRLLTGSELSSPKHIFIPYLLDELTDNPDDFFISGSVIVFDEGEISIEGFEVDASEKMIYKLLPPSEEPGREMPFVWLMMKPKTNEPYLFSDRARRKEKIPPPGISSLPAAVRGQIPKEFRFWEVGSKSKAIMTLDALRQALKKKQIVLDYEGSSIYKRAQSDWIIKATSLPYVLKKRWWRGPIVVRLGSSAIFWDLYFKVGPGWNHFTLSQNPETYSSFVGILDRDVSQGEVDIHGEIPPKTDLNPNERLIAQCEILGEGSLKFIAENSAVWNFAFDTGILKGKAFTASQDEGSSIWRFSEII